MNTSNTPKIVLGNPILAAIGEFERELIRERSLEGRMKALQRGVKFGARPKLSAQEVKELVKDFEAPGGSKSEIAEHYGISRATVYRLYHLNQRNADCQRTKNSIREKMGWLPVSFSSAR